MSWLLIDSNDSSMLSESGEDILSESSSSIMVDEVLPLTEVYWVWLARAVIVALIYHWYRTWLNGRWFTNPQEARGKVCIVTGANTGIGLETAAELAARGAYVILACRDPQRGEHAKRVVQRRTFSKTVRFVQLDLASFDSIRRFCVALEALDDETDGRLDILVNNAGVMAVPSGMRTEEGLEPHMGVNHYGPFLLTLLLLKRLSRTQGARVVNVTSISHLWVRGSREDLMYTERVDRFRAYAISKLAGMMFTRGLADRLGRDGVTVNAVHPGVVHTDIPRNLSSLSMLLNQYICSFVSWLVFRTPKSGSQCTLFAALDLNLAFVTGKFFEYDARQGHNLWFRDTHPNVNDPTEVDWFWQYSEQVTGYTFAEAMAESKTTAPVKS